MFASVRWRTAIAVCILLSGLATVIQSAPPSPIHGCPDLESIEEIDSDDAASFTDLLLCFCQVRPKGHVAVSCLYGSTLEHLEKASAAVTKANMTITQLSIQHMEFPSEGLLEGVLHSMTPHLEQLDIRECAGTSPLKIDDGAFMDLESTLVNVTIHDCKLTDIPAAFGNLTLLKTLALTSNDIDALDKSTFAGKTKLRYLDLSGNMITTVEEGTFSDLSHLDTLIIGDHNYLNGTLVDEIAKLASLEVLDISKADGIFAPPEELFPHLMKLKVLKMGGCSLSTIEPGVFAPLGMLEQLDLRVNLIENISALAFDGLTSLKRLSLAGNYIRQVESDNWAGLASLEDLDLGWNELKTFDTDAFAAIESSLMKLDLRHNPLTTLPAISLPELRSIILSETNITDLNADMFKGLPKLEAIEALRANISSISPNTFGVQKHVLKKLLLSGNKLRNFDLPLESVPALEELALSSNPFQCDEVLGKFIDDVNEAYRRAAANGKGFAVPNSNETVCARPWKLRGQSVLGLEADDLEKYDEALDTTTPVATTTPGAETTTTTETTLAFTLPDLFAGRDTNESIFKDDRERLQYNLAETDATHQKEENADKSNVVYATIGILGLVTVIGAVAVVFFMKKRKQISPSATPEKKSPRRVEDGMEEIELNASHGGRGGVGGPGPRQTRSTSSRN